MSFQRPLGLAFVGFGLLLAGCETTEIYYPTIEVPVDANGFESGAFVANPAFAGIWTLQEGAIIPSVDPNLRIQALQIDLEGHARVYVLDLATGAVDEVLAWILYDGRTAVLDLKRDPAFAGSSSVTTMFFPLVVVEAGLLGLADESGRIALLASETAVPAELVPGSLPFAHSFEGLPAPNLFGDLVLYGEDLVYNSTLGNIERWSPGVQALGSPVGPTSGRYVQTAEPSWPLPHLWHHCACGPNYEIERSNLANTLDTVHTGDDLGHPIVIRAAAYVSTSNSLWLHGWSPSQSRYNMLAVDASAEPDVRERIITFDRRILGLSFDGTDVWGLVFVASLQICRIDPLTARVTATYDIPDQDVHWSGLEFDAEGHLYLLGLDRTGEGVLMRTDATTGVPLDPEDTLRGLR